METLYRKMSHKIYLKLRIVYQPDPSDLDSICMFYMQNSHILKRQYYNLTKHQYFELAAIEAYQLLGGPFTNQRGQQMKSIIKLIFPHELLTQLRPDVVLNFLTQEYKKLEFASLRDALWEYNKCLRPQYLFMTNCFESKFFIQERH